MIGEIVLTVGPTAIGITCLLVAALTILLKYYKQIWTAIIYCARNIANSLPVTIAGVLIMSGLYLVLPSWLTEPDLGPGRCLIIIFGSAFLIVMILVPKN
jgi:ABC-type dipeptide/oligopeptide/nickel transport system permease subunit